MSISAGATYVRRALAAADGSVNLLANERILSASGDERSGVVVWIAGTGPAPKDAATLATRPPLPPAPPDLPDTGISPVISIGPPKAGP